MFWISHPSFRYLANVLILPALEIYLFFFFQHMDLSSPTRD